MGPYLLLSGKDTILLSCCLLVGFFRCRLITFLPSVPCWDGHAVVFLKVLEFFCLYDPFINPTLFSGSLASDSVVGRKLGFRWTWRL